MLGSGPPVWPWGQCLLVQANLTRVWPADTLLIWLSRYLLSLATGNTSCDTLYQVYILMNIASWTLLHEYNFMDVTSWNEYILMNKTSWICSTKYGLKWVNVAWYRWYSSVCKKIVTQDTFESCCRTLKRKKRKIPEYCCYGVWKSSWERRKGSTWCRRAADTTARRWHPLLRRR